MDVKDVTESHELRYRGFLCEEQGRLAEAVEYHRRALRLRIQERGQDLLAGQSLNNLADALRVQGKFSQSEAAQDRALWIKLTVSPRDWVSVARSLTILARLFYEQARYPEAEECCRYALNALNKKEEHLGPDHTNLAITLNTLSDTWRAQGDHQEAELHYERARAIWTRTQSPGHPEVAWSLRGLAKLRVSEGEHRRAEQLLLEARKIEEKALGLTHLGLGQTFTELARLYLKQGRVRQAEPLLQRSLAISKACLGPGHPHTADTLAVYAVLLRTASRPEEAERMEAEAALIRAMHARANPAISTRRRAQWRTILGWR